MVKIAIDANGGDFGVNTTVKGSMMAVKKIKDLELVLYGDEAKIKPLLTDSTRITIVDTKTTIDMGIHVNTVKLMPVLQADQLNV